MSVLGNATSSFFSATNENYAALANVKFDFALLKLEAPVEFNGIASALSTKRRIDAEEGPTHKTARRLGALFEDLIPSTPKLISAYGLRMSEIINTSGINATGSDYHGPFEPFVGADGTTLWAAATSGISALGVYFLSCLLARAWDAKASTALWVELVAARRQEIEEGFKNNHNVSPSSIVGARQDITRSDLALWDSSARAWLRRADQAKAWAQSQLSLIFKNINVPVAGGPSTYAKAIDVWRRSMIGMENFLCGRPQLISDGSLFLAFSAWHLFPDLIVLGNEPIKVSFKDKLIPSTGVGTVGVESRTAEDREGIQWSLTLSHLQYYGDPILVQSNRDYSRVTFTQLRLVAFGSWLGAWRISPRDFLLVAEWFQFLWGRMRRSDEGGVKANLSHRFGWLYQIVKAASDLLGSKGPTHQHNLMLLKHGTRRAKTFLSDRQLNLSPFFGLCNPLSIAGLSEKLDVDCGISYLRAVAEKLGLNSSNAVICYAHGAQYLSNPRQVKCFEYATVAPHTKASTILESNNQLTHEKVHARWFCTKTDSTLSSSSEVRTRTPFASAKKEAFADDEVQDKGWVIEARLERLSQQGEICCRSNYGVSFDRVHNSFDWKISPSLYPRDDLEAPEDECHSTTEGTIPWHCFETNPDVEPSPLHFEAVVGDWRLGLFLHRSRGSERGSVGFYRQKARYDMEKADRPSAAIQNFKYATVTSERLQDYMCVIMNEPGSNDAYSQTAHSQTPGISLISSAHTLQPDCSKSLYAIYTASKIYRNMSGATISLKLFERPLHSSAWFQSLFLRVDNDSSASPSTSETRAPILTPLKIPLPDQLESFACIAMFDSGTINLNPMDLEHAFALCSEDSIYVPEVVLSDPFVRVPDHQMRHIVGNIGRPGISLLVAPNEPRIRNLSDSYNLVMHEAYDFKRENNFKETSLHLSFTDWTFPLETGGPRTIDHDVLVVESVVSVCDRGQWVADIDVLNVDFKNILRFESSKSCNVTHENTSEFDYTSIDSWEELLDEPRTVGIFRAHGNWAARLAVVSILSRNENGHNFGIFGPESFCLKCIEEEYETPGWNLLDYESPMPSFCID